MVIIKEGIVKLTLAVARWNGKNWKIMILELFESKLEEFGREC
jgi:hypothetical protein